MSIDFSQEESQTSLMTSSALRPEDEGETSLRPKRPYRVHRPEKAKRTSLCSSTRPSSGTSPDHVLHGPPGLGKTTPSPASSPTRWG